jgi:hypothetical protein
VRNASPTRTFCTGVRHTHTHTLINVTAYLGVCILARMSGFPNHITRPGNTKRGCARIYFIRVTDSHSSIISPAAATTDPTPEADGGGEGRGAGGTAAESQTVRTVIVETVRGHIGEKEGVGGSATLAILDRVAALCEEV